MSSKRPFILDREHQINNDVKRIRSDKDLTTYAQKDQETTIAMDGKEIDDSIPNNSTEDKSHNIASDVKMQVNPAYRSEIASDIGPPPNNTLSSLKSNQQPPKNGSKNTVENSTKKKKAKKKRKRKKKKLLGQCDFRFHYLQDTSMAQELFHNSIPKSVKILPSKPEDIEGELLLFDQQYNYFL